MSILHNTADAEDAVQETFVRIISNLSKIDCANEKRSKAYILLLPAIFVMIFSEKT